MNNDSQSPFSNLTNEVVSGITGFELSTYLVALEGWRRGLTLKWYKDESDLCKLHRINSTTHGKFFSLSSENRKHFFLRSRGDKVSNKTVTLVQNKDKTKKLLSQQNVPVPKGDVFDISEQEQIVKYAEQIGFPVIIKPLNGSMGQAVYTNINNTSQLIDAMENAQETYRFKKYMLEKHYFGNEYRVYVVGDQVIGATNRIPANVTGDGVNSVKELIRFKNEKRLQIPYLSSKLINIDYEVKEKLKSLGYDEMSIPKQGEIIYLREVSNITSGGDPVDATNELSDEIKQIAVNGLKALPSIPHAGLDIIVDPKRNDKAVILEVNATAEIGMHSFPSHGQARDIPGAIIDYYFPETIGQEKSDFYFDYKSMLEPLKTWAAEEILVPQPPIGKIYRKKYIVSGKVKNVGYSTWIKRQALRRNLLGYTKNAGKGKVEVVVMSKNKKTVDRFIDLCKKGSRRSKVDYVETQPFDIIVGEPLKMGFEVLQKTGSELKNKNNTIEELTETNKQLINELNKVRNERNYYKKQYEAIKGSIDLFIIKPVRKLAKFIKKRKKRDVRN